MRSFRSTLNSLWAATLALPLFAAGTLQAQSDNAPPQPLGPWLRATLPITSTEVVPPASPIVDPMVQQAGCCGTSSRGNGGASYGCSNNHCIPGRAPCHGCNSDTVIGRLIGGFYDAICCPDPCYEPRFIAEANAAFFQDGPRPASQTRIRWDAGYGYGFPDTAEFFWAQINKKGPKNPVASLRYNDLSFYTEVAVGAVGTFVEMPYRNLDSTTNPSTAGMADMNIGVKTVLLDSELILVTMQIRTFLPIGNPTVGLGTGHVSLEPSLMCALKLAPVTYLQTQISDWIPLGGTPGFAGSVIHFHASLNHSLCRQGDCLNVVGTLEMNGYSFRGQFTDFPGGNVEGMGGSVYMNGGPGVRVIFCDRYDLGVGTAFGFGNGHGPNQLYRTELRLRF